MAETSGSRLVDRWVAVLAASQDPGLSRGDIAVMMTILEHMNASGIAWPGLSRIAREARVSRPQVTRCIAKLEQRGFLMRESGDRKTPNKYRIGPAGRRTCEPTSGFTDEPTGGCADEPTGRCTDDSGVGAPVSIGVGAPMNLEPASKATYPLNLEDGSPEGDLLQATTVARRSVVPECPHQQIIDLYHQQLPELVQMRSWGPERQKLLRARWREDRDRQSLDFWGDLFEYVRGSDFLMGRVGGHGGRPPFTCDLEWIIRPRNFAKIIEGRYHAEASGPVPSAPVYQQQPRPSLADQCAAMRIQREPIDA